MKLENGKSLTIVVEGIGHVVQNYYAPALIDQKQSSDNNLSIIFVDESEHWRNSKDVKRIEKCENFITRLEGWADYIDKSTEEGKKEYSQLKANVVFIATPDKTHVHLALNWLLDENKCEGIFIEKPLDSSLSKARVLQFYSMDKNHKIFPLDHYLARSIPIRNSDNFERLINSIGGGIEQITFYLLEDRSVPYRGPIENDNRTSSVEKGLVLDMFPHILALVHHLGIIESIEITNLKVARYTYENESGETIRASIPKETFANIEFSFKDYSEPSKIIQAKVFIGKGVSGSIKLGIRGDLKRLEILGNNGKKCLVDLRNTDRGGSGQVEIEDENGERTLTGIKLLDEPYSVVLQQIIDKNSSDPNTDLKFNLPIKTAKDSLTCMHEILSLIENFENTELEIPSYHIKTVIEDGKPVSYAPPLEDIMSGLGEVRDIIGIDKLIRFYESEIQSENAKEAI